MMACLYVDDIIYLGSSEQLIKGFKEQMMERFEMTDLGILHYYLGLEINYLKNGIAITQRKYVGDLLQKFRMKSCKSCSTSMNSNRKLKLDDGTTLADEHRFRSMVKGLLYLTHT